MNRPINIVTLVASILLAILVALYFFTPIFDELVIEKSLKRYCETQKSEFSGEFFTPAYLCTFIEGTE